MTRLALIGYGPWARNIHRTVDSLRDVDLHSVCRLRPELTPAGIRDRVLVTSSLEEALDGADAAVVATDPSSHRELAIACLKAGLPTMLEKPVALSVADSDAVFRTADDSGVPLLVNNVHLFSLAFETLRAMTSAWDPVDIVSEGGSDGPVRDYSALLDWGPHDVSMALSLLSDPLTAASVHRLPSVAGELYEVRLRAGGSSAVLRVGTGFTSKRRRFEVRCGSRFAVYDDLAAQKLTVDGRRVRLPVEEPLRRAVLALHRAAKDGVVDWRFSVALNRGVMSALLGS